MKKETSVEKENLSSYEKETVFFFILQVFIERRMKFIFEIKEFSRKWIGGQESHKLESFAEAE